MSPIEDIFVAKSITHMRIRDLTTHPHVNFHLAVPLVHPSDLRSVFSDSPNIISNLYRISKCMREQPCWHMIADMLSRSFQHEQWAVHLVTSQHTSWQMLHSVHSRTTTTVQFGLLVDLINATLVFSLACDKHISVTA